MADPAEQKPETEPSPPVSESSPPQSEPPSADSNVEGKPLDLSSEGTGVVVPLSPKFGNEYDSRPQEDEARRNIAYILISILAFIVFVLFGMVGCETINSGEIKEFSVILGPIVTLVSAATGFYYGTKSK